MAYGFVEQSGGRLRLRSQPGKGTIAELWFPVVTGDGKPQARGRAAGDACSPGRTATSRAHVVLAVDTDRLVLMNTTAILNSLGHQVFTATSSAQALSLIRREGLIDLVIIDQAMPTITGMTLADTIKAEWPGLSVVLAARPLDENSIGRLQ